MGPQGRRLHLVTRLYASPPWSQSLGKTQPWGNEQPAHCPRFLRVQKWNGCSAQYRSGLRLKTNPGWEIPISRHQKRGALMDYSLVRALPTRAVLGEGRSKPRTRWKRLKPAVKYLLGHALFSALH